jgi:hypothetical protein
MFCNAVVKGGRASDSSKRMRFILRRDFCLRHDILDEVAYPIMGQYSTGLVTDEQRIRCVVGPTAETFRNGSAGTKARDLWDPVHPLYYPLAVCNVTLLRMANKRKGGWGFWEARFRKVYPHHVPHPQPCKIQEDGSFAQYRVV